MTPASHTTSTMSTPSFHSQNGSANPAAPIPFDDSGSSQSFRRRNMLSSAANLINQGGLQPGSNPSAAPQTSQPEDICAALDLYDKQFLPHQAKSLSGIALRSFALGSVLTVSLTFSVYLLYIHNTLWRAPFFVATLSVFHFLEFWTTAKANTPNANVSSFLLSSNGSAYKIAHSAAFLETIFCHTLLPTYLSPTVHAVLLFLGLFLIITGQVVRSFAMLTAGQNFSHIVRHTKSQTHVLVTTGIYGIFRHPSYFGFFWWGIGTQLVCGNWICLAGYAYVLWIFFYRRILGEEKLLVDFFGEEYVDYRKKTRVGIPFIW
jgi:protein-S-isoprenylcysteine O-methyltransferase